VINHEIIEPTLLMIYLSGFCVMIIIFINFILYFILYFISYFIFALLFKKVVSFAFFLLFHRSAYFSSSSSPPWPVSLVLSLLVLLPLEAPADPAFFSLPHFESVLLGHQLQLSARRRSGPRKFFFFC
jgi:hypothetical protein